MRISLRVRPGAGRTAVGGGHDGALVVRVAAPAVDGAPPRPHWLVDPLAELLSR